MANIDQYLEEIEVASRGEEVRDSIIDAFEALNSEGPGTMDWDNITDTPDTLAGYGVSDVPASMVSGVLALNNIPPSALERVVPVADDTARFALTSSDVQNGDTVKVLSTMKLYLVVDDTSLSTEAGYEEYKAGTADSVDWSGVLNTPDTLAGYGIEDAYTKDEVDDITTSEEEESEAGNPIVIETDAAQYAKKTHLTLEPVQDLHGYDHPWPAGGGKNLFDEQYPNIDGSMRRIYVQTGDGTFTLSTTALIVEGAANLFLQTGQATSGEATATNGVYSGAPRTVTATDGYVTISYRIVNNTPDAGNPLKCKTQLEAGSTATSYEPYSNICPITGVDEVKVERTGKNLLLNKMARTVLSNGITYSLKDDGTVVLNGTASSTSLCDFLLSSDKYIIPKGDYILSDDYSKAGSWGTFLSLYKDGVRIAPNLATTYGSGVTSKAFSTSSYDYDAIAVGIYIASGVSLNNAVFKPMIRLASITDATYEPYISSVSSVDLPETVYGGTLDLETGELVCDYAIEDMGDMGWTLDTSHRFASANRPLCKLQGKLVCSAYNGVQKGTALLVNGEIAATGTQAYMFFRVVDEMFSDATSFTASVVGQKLVYELADPITYQLTPQQLALFKGINNISANVKTVQVTYRNGELATTGNIVDAVEVAKQNAIGESASYTDARLATELAPILGNLASAETSPASASHAVGEYLLYNGNLYKVLAAISSGQQLTIGTNIGQTNVAAELVRLNSLLT